MEIRVLKYFLAVVREESITKAAEVLHITKPTLSRQLALLEEEVGVKAPPYRTAARQAMPFPPSALSNFLTCNQQACKI